jgi:hypothetical protein
MAETISEAHGPEAPHSWGPGTPGSGAESSVPRTIRFGRWPGLVLLKTADGKPSESSNLSPPAGALRKECPGIRHRRPARAA